MTIEKNSQKKSNLTIKKPSAAPMTLDEERKRASDARWDKSKRSSTEQSIMDAGRQPNEKK